MKASIRSLLLSSLSGTLAGLSATLFLYLLDYATHTREAHPHLIWGLPLAGLYIGWSYWRYGKKTEDGYSLILEQLQNPTRTTPARMAPLILSSTIITHLFGGSAGREGTAVQMGASLTDQLTHFFNLDQNERRHLLIAGTGAGFAAAIGAPLAGAIFGLEVVKAGYLQWRALVVSAIASFVAYGITLLLRAPHSVFPPLESFQLQHGLLVAIFIAGILFGLTARYFVQLTHYCERRFFSWLKSPPLKPFFGGLLLVVLFRLEGSYRFDGLGIEVIQDALRETASPLLPFYKMFFTALTLAAGFKGGEFVPLVFIGSTMGSALTMALPAGAPLLAYLGFVAVFAGAANTPLACTILAGELFGWSITPYALLACFLSYYFSGHQGIYRGQLKGPKCTLGTKLKSALKRRKP
jgi:H+/Cl- antiporter ClcA